MHYGLGLGHILMARDRQLTQGVAIALGEILLSVALLALIGLLMTRHFAELIRVSGEVARGNFAFAPLEEGDHDIGRLGRAFNAMAHAVDERIRELAGLRDALQRERDLAQVTLASIGDGVVTTDAEGRVTFLNAMAEKLTGWTQEEAAGQPVTEVVALSEEEGGRLPSHPVLECLRSGHGVSLQADVVLESRDGRRTPVEDKVAPILDRGGVGVGAVMVFADVSATREISRLMAWQASHDSLTAGQSKQLRAAPESPARRTGQGRPRACPALPRPGPVQDRQRPVRAHGGGPVAGAGDLPDARADAQE